MAGWRALFRGAPREPAMAPLYAAIIAVARHPDWYRRGEVPDTLDGRFDMVATVLAMVLLRLEEEDTARAESATLVERFVDDMDGQLRQLGIGDLVVGRHVGRMMAALGGRIGAYREGLTSGGLGAALARNLYRDAAVPAEAAAWTDTRLRRFVETLRATAVEALLDGALPAA